MDNPIEISIEQLADLPEAAYTLVDVRDEISYNYGTMPHAVSMPDIVERAEKGELSGDRKLVLFCMHGDLSYGMTRALQALGYDAVSLHGGYSAWLIADMDTEDRSEEIEESIRKNKRYHKVLFSRFTKAINTYELIQPGDRIAVCVSGGKDSFLMAKLFQELRRHNKFPFEVKFLCMDPGYNELNRLVIERNAQICGVPLEIFETNIFDAVDQIEKSPCYLCARMRRGYLYSEAKKRGCNKIALGHHYDDVIETILMGMLYGAQVQTMMPKLRSTNFEGMELIRPMYLIREDDIKSWRDYNRLHFIQCACHFTDTCSSCREDGTAVSKRMETKLLIRGLKETNPFVEGNIFKSVENVNLKTIIAYKKDGVKHSFLETYDQQENTEK